MTARTELQTLQRYFPNLTKTEGMTPTIRKALFESNPRLLGVYAEEVIAANGKGWKTVKKPNAPQNDLYRFKNGAFEGAQVKLHGKYDFSTYMNDMKVDNKAERFMVASDHVSGLRRDLLAKAKLARNSGLLDEAVRLERDATRVTSLGATAAQLEARLMRGLALALGSTAAASAVMAAGGAIVIDVALISYDAMTEGLTVSELEVRLIDASIKAAASGSAVAIAIVVFGANPVGLTVMIVGGSAYIITDVAIQVIRSNFMVASASPEAMPYILSGWKETSWP